MKRHREIRRARLVVTRDEDSDSMTLLCEASDESDPQLPVRVSASIRELYNLRGAVELVQLGTLPNDGKVIEDRRERA